MDEKKLIEGLRLDALLDAQINFGENVTQLTQRFVNEVGQHETMDRIFIVQENFYDYIAKHPFVLLNPELFNIAQTISDLMADLYQRVAQEL